MWNNKRGYQNGSLLTVSKKNEQKNIKNARFSWFLALFVIKQGSRVEGSRPNPSGRSTWLEKLTWLSDFELAER